MVKMFFVFVWTLSFILLKVRAVLAMFLAVSFYKAVHYMIRECIQTVSDQ